MMLLMAMAAAAGQVSMPPRPLQGQWQQRGPGRPGGPGGFGDGRGFDRFFEMADTDRNGQLSKAELQSARAKFREHRMERRQQRQGQ